MIDRADYQLEFNGQDYRVMAFERDLVTKIVRPRQLGVPSQDLQLVLRSACADLGGNSLVLTLKVRPK